MQRRERKGGGINSKMYNHYSKESSITENKLAVQVNKATISSMVYAIVSSNLQTETN